MLLLTGRTADGFAARVARRTRPWAPTSARGATSAGQITRDTVANLMEPYIDDTFYRLTGLNLRLTVGSDGFQGRVRKRISRTSEPADRLPAGVLGQQPLDDAGATSGWSTT